MTNKTRQTRQITIETHSVTIIRTNGKPLSAFCEHCQQNVTVFAPEQIAAFFRLTLAEVCRRVEKGKLHFVGTRRGVALICGSSLNNSEDNSE
ncbi:MAG: hypothetical protein M3Q33_10615 [Acidobacteriota bacterium]|nr:hypothetical protein [Acidobacteriota bacterium]